LQDSDAFDAPMKEKNCVTVYGNRVQLLPNKVIITQQASLPYRQCAHRRTHSPYARAAA
jgi:hypothetical protein